MGLICSCTSGGEQLDVADESRGTAQPNLSEQQGAAAGSHAQSSSVAGGGAEAGASGETPPTDAGPRSGATDASSPQPEPQPTPDTDPIVEPVIEADYFVRNGLDTELQLSATTIVGGQPIELLTDTVPAHDEAHIFHAVEGTGGHAMPSNFFGSFRIESAGQVLYEGVRNEDWQAQSIGFVLAVATAPTERIAPDYSCAQASDCAIKNVGNCCGYYPRCVRADAPDPTPAVCEPGVSGVCGWPEISHCECVDNTCRSMQGDQDV